MYIDTHNRAEWTLITVASLNRITNRAVEFDVERSSGHIRSSLHGILVVIAIWRISSCLRNPLTIGQEEITTHSSLGLEPSARLAGFTSSVVHAWVVERVSTLTF